MPRPQHDARLATHLPPESCRRRAARPVENDAVPTCGLPKRPPHSSSEARSQTKAALALAALIVHLANHRFEHFGVPLDRDHDRPLLDAVGGAGHQRQHLPPVGHRLAERE